METNWRWRGNFSC